MASPTGTWVAFKEHGRWARPRFLSVEVSRLKELRAAVRRAYVETELSKREAERVGFVPRTFALWAISRAGLEAPRAASDDDVCLSFAYYMFLKVYLGTWEEGPRGRGIALAPVYVEASPGWESL
jgi:hypothetical protein